jgi:hypothetical protein
MLRRNILEVVQAEIVRKLTKAGAIATQTFEIDLPAN